jgi:predicted esterase
LCDWPTDYTGQYPDNICELAGTPAWLFHGGADRNVPYQASEVIAEALAACGGDVQFTLEERAGHGLAAFTPDVFEWLLAQGYDGDWAALGSG